MSGYHDPIAADGSDGSGFLDCRAGQDRLPFTGEHAQNEQVHVAASRIYAVEGGCFVLAPSATVSPEMVELMCTDDSKRALLRAGGGHARIIGPDGRDLATPLPETEEGLLYAEIDTGMIPLAKAAADPAGKLGI